MLKLLLDEGANLNAVLDDEVSVLQLALGKNDTKLFPLLLAREADPTLLDNYESTPLHEACRHELELEVDTLLEITSNLARLVNCESVHLRTSLYVVARKGFDQILTRLLDSEVEINKIESNNLLDSTLMIACAKSHENVVRLLLSRNASQEIEESRFKLAVMTAQAFRREAIVNILESTTAAQVEEIA